jgi:protein CpxP
MYVQGGNQEDEMQSTKSRFAAMMAGLAMFAGMAIAQDQTAPASGSPKHHMMRHFRGGPEFGLPLRQLNLTDDQKAQVKQIFQNERANIKPLMQQERTAHEAMAQLVTSGSFAEDKATAIANQEAQTHVRMQVEHAKIASQIYQLLSADQKAKVAQIIAQRQQRMQERMQNQQSVPQSE